MSHQPGSFLADPLSLAPYSEEHVLQVVIETPRNSRNKYTYDPDRRVLMLKKVLPAGMVFPYDFGFVPSTRADDGDAIDVLLLMDEPAFPGCVLDARLIGVIQGENQLEDGSTRRNDRLLAVATLSQIYGNIHTIDDLPQKLLRGVQEFFVNYPSLLGGKTYNLLGPRGPEEAARLVEQAMENVS